MVCKRSGVIVVTGRKSVLKLADRIGQSDRRTSIELELGCLPRLFISVDELLCELAPCRIKSTCSIALAMSRVAHGLAEKRMGAMESAKSDVWRSVTVSLP
jgi:hypothetical protein